MMQSKKHWSAAFTPLHGSIPRTVRFQKDAPLSEDIEAACTPRSDAISRTIPGLVAVQLHRLGLRPGLRAWTEARF